MTEAQRIEEAVKKAEEQGRFLERDDFLLLLDLARSYLSAIKAGVPEEKGSFVGKFYPATGEHKYNAGFDECRSQMLALIVERDREIRELKKHDCQRWHDEGVGCSICFYSGRLSKDEIKELQETNNGWITSLQAELSRIKAIGVEEIELEIISKKYSHHQSIFYHFTRENIRNLAQAIHALIHGKKEEGK